MEKRLVEKMLRDIDDVIYDAIMEDGECCGTMGGASAPYSTPMNTMGIGDPVPPTMNHCGGCDRYDRPIAPMGCKRPPMMGGFLPLVVGIQRTSTSTKSKKRKSSTRKKKRSSSSRRKKK